jgi:hypothetical protein
VIEFNGTIQHDVAFIQARDMSVKQGSSLQAMTELARSRGYELVATTLWNAFFVTRELFDRFGIADNSPANMHHAPMALSLFQLYDGTLVLGGWSAMNWINLRFSLEDIQVLPKRLRLFNPELARSSVILSPDGKHRMGNPWLLGPADAPANRFGRAARNKYSFYGDDGVLEALLRELGCESGHFLDVGSGGAQDGSRVWALTETGWTGHIARIAAVPVADLAEQPAQVKSTTDVPLPPGVVIIDTPPVEFDKILGFLRPITEIDRKIDLLSIGVFGADYQIWRALAWLEPMVVAVQFNPTIPNDIFFVQADDYNVHQGCSLQALIDLGRKFDYELAACSLATAFFVPKDMWSRLGVSSNNIDDMHVPRYSMRLFQLFDGTLKLHGVNQLLWHGIALDEDAIQPLPKALRRWPANVPSGPHQQLYTQVN